MRCFYKRGVLIFAPSENFAEFHIKLSIIKYFCSSQPLFCPNSTNKRSIRFSCIVLPMQWMDIVYVMGAIS